MNVALYMESELKKRLPYLKNGRSRSRVPLQRDYVSDLN